MSIKQNTQRVNLKLSKKVNIAPYLFILPFYIIYLTFNFYPIISSFFLSFFKWDGLTARKFVGFDNYIHLFTKDPYFFKSLGNVVIIMLEYIPLSIIIGLLLANICVNSRMKYRKFYQTTNFLPYIITPVAVGIIFTLLFDWSTGIVNRTIISLGMSNEGVNWLGDPINARIVVGLMLLWKNFGYCMIIYISALTSIPQSLYEAAWIDGANARDTFFHITIPQLKGTTFFLVVTTIINGFQLFDEPKLLLSGTTMGAVAVGGPDRSCLTPVWNLYDVTFGATGGDPRLGYGAALTYGIFIFITIVTIINYRLMRGGASD